MSKNFQVYGIGQALIPVLPPPLGFENAPNSNQTNYEIGQVVYTPPNAPTAFYMYAGGGNWVEFATSGGDVLSVTGTANQILANPTSGAVVLSLIGPYTPATYTAHGVLIGEGTSSIAATAAGTTGQVLIGATAADPAFGALGVNSNLTGLVVGNTNSAFTTATYTPATSYTPAFSLATPGNSTWTYTGTPFGRFNRVGDVVHFTASLTWSNFTNTTGSGVWRVSIPVAAGAFTLPGQLSIQGSGIDASAETANLPANFYGKIATGASVCTLSIQEGGIGNAASASFDLTVTQVKTAGTLTISGFYFAS